MTAKTAVLIGGGVIGIEMAWELTQLGIRCTILEAMPRLMARQLDAESAALLQESIRSGACNPFLGPLYTQSGRVLENDALLTPEQIINMDYLMENVVGEIPHYEDLSELGKATVDMVGVAPATKEGKV